MADDVLDVLDDEEEEGAVSIASIYSFLYQHEDIIITINAADEESVRRGLALEKHRQQKKLKEAGAPEDSRTLGFMVLGPVAEHPEQIRLQIYLRKKQAVKLHQMIVSDKEM